MTQQDSNPENKPFYVFYVETSEGRKVVSYFEQPFEEDLQIGDTLYLKYEYTDLVPHIVLINHMETKRDKLGIEVTACYASEIM